MLDRPVEDPLNIKMEPQKSNPSDKDEPELNVCLIHEKILNIANY